MKKILAFAALFGMMISAKAQDSNWPQMDEFHHILAVVYHGWEANDKKPAYERSGEMAAKAKILATSPIPAEKDTPEFKNMLMDLAGKCSIFASFMSQNPDEEVAWQMLEEIHDLYHKIEEQ